MLVFLKGSSIFLGGCFAKCSRATWDGGKEMASAFLVLAMTWGPRAGVLLRPEKSLGRNKEACEGVFRAVLEGSCPSESKQECSCSCWAIAPQKAAGTRSPPYKGREGFTKQLQ